MVISVGTTVRLERLNAVKASLQATEAPEAEERRMQSTTESTGKDDAFMEDLPSSQR